jgi:hypothetical protein
MLLVTAAETPATSMVAALFTNVLFILSGYQNQQASEAFARPKAIGATYRRFTGVENNARCKRFKAMYEVANANIIIAREARKLYIVKENNPTSAYTNRMELNELTDLPSEGSEAVQNQMTGNKTGCGVAVSNNVAPKRPDEAKFFKRKLLLLENIFILMVSTVCGFLLMPTPLLAETWQLLNGEVVLNDPVTLFREGEAKQTSSFEYKLRNPQIVGVGGGGAVFAFEDSQKLLKVSWENSAESVQRECSALQLLERKNVEFSERCLGSFKYDGNRVMILMEPYVSDGVATVMDLDPSKRAPAVRQIARTLIQMLAANAVTVDVQLLISKSSGQVTFIDLTESQELTPPFTFLDKTLMSSFISEMLTLIPDQFLDTAAQAAINEISSLEANGVIVSPEALEVLHMQTGFFEI